MVVIYPINDNGLINTVKITRFQTKYRDVAGFFVGVLV
jgi:hypothetical protein